MWRDSVEFQREPEHKKMHIYETGRLVRCTFGKRMDSYSSSIDWQTNRCALLALPTSLCNFPSALGCTSATLSFNRTFPDWPRTLARRAPTPLLLRVIPRVPGGISAFAHLGILLVRGLAFRFDDFSLPGLSDLF